MVRILSDKNGNSATGELLEEMGRLHAEIDRLRKIIDSIKSVLGTDVFESTTSRQALPSTYNDHPDSPDHDMKMCEANSSSDDCNHVQAVDDWGSTITVNQGEMNEYTQTNMEVGEGPPETPMDTNSVREAVDWTNSLDETAVALTSRWDGMRSPNFKQPPIWSLPSPVKTRLPTPPPPDFVQCKFWKKANSIYGRIFDYDKERILAANNVDSGALFKVVKEGWGSLTPRERENPVLQILEEVDQNLFWDLDPVTKIANLYKSHLILKYYFNAEKRNLELIPAWQRPVHSQRIRRHPLPIDFFPWPALRDRLMRHYHYYFATSEFSVHYRQNFKFNWPFGFDETYRYSPSTGTYRISPLFERYYSDEKSWSMEKLFFQKFPEYIGEIPVHEVNPRKISSSPSPPDTVRLSDPIGNMNHSPNCSNSNGSFEDECMMALFDELPPT